MNNRALDCEEKMNKSLLSLEKDLSSVRTGRANPNILDKITIDYFGVQTPINQVGNIIVNEARVLQVQPWDINVLKLIEQAIINSDLGVNPTNDGSIIRIVLPEITEERRKVLTKEVKKKGEDCKVAVRNLRREGIDAMKKLLKNKEIAEDEYQKLENEFQKLTDKYVSKIDKVVENKNKDIMSI